MAAYMFQVAYTPDGWARLIASPQDRIEAVKPAVEQLDGTVIAGWLCFGEYDLIAIVDLPDNVSAAAFSIAASAGGTVSKLHTTPLMSTDDGIRAMEKAQSSVYTPAPSAGEPAHA
jgi:uncharacterized protein with GYD domain